MSIFFKKTARTSPTLFFGLVLFLSACDRNKSSHDSSLILEKSEIKIDHGDLLLPDTFIFSKIIGKDSLLRFESGSLTLYLFDIKNKKVLKVNQFDSEGPNFMEAYIRDIEKTSSGYIIQGANYLHFVNNEGLIDKRILTNQFTSDFSSAEYNLDKIKKLNDQQILVSKHIKSTMYPYQIDSPRISIFGILNPENDSLIDLPVYSPEETLANDPERGYYSTGFYKQYFVLEGENLVFSFKFSPSIYVYNMSKQTIEKHVSTSQRFSKNRDPIPSELMRDVKARIGYSNTGVRFSGLCYDTETGLYIRLVSDYQYNSANERVIEKYLQVLDKEFEILKELLMDEIVFDAVYVSNGVIYLLPNQYIEESTRILKYEIVQ